uniref:alpha-glucosidase n=1 Tax=Culicoides sonorensis TaxID=179676 RepID=A0A336M6J3_CULSO
MVRDSIENANDGADEKMLGDETEKLAQKEIEVKFIQGADVNGDAQIDIGDVKQASQQCGMSKEELMKYVNDPFWIKLRWFLFILFWLVWLGMLGAALYIIVDAPKCVPPEEHTWWKQGPLIISEDDSGLSAPNEDTLSDLKNFGAKAVIYKLPADETYKLGDDEKKRIKELADTLLKNDIQLVLDVTANYVSDTDELYTNTSYRDAFVVVRQQYSTWKSLNNQPAFKPLDDGTFILSQFGPNQFDLRMDNAHAKEKFKSVLKTLVDLGVKGFRLTNTKHFIINPNNEIKDKMARDDPSDYANDQYNFYSHEQSTFNDKLGELLNEYRTYVKNITDNEGFLAVTDDIERPDVYQTGAEFGVDLPQYGRLEKMLRGGAKQSDTINVLDLKTDLEKSYAKVGALSWVQHTYNKNAFTLLGPSEFNIFVFLLPGVPVTTLEALKQNRGNDSALDQITQLETLRQSPSLQHGEFHVYTDANETTIAYTRHKSGNPGYFVVLNPSDTAVTGNFTHVDGLSPELKWQLLSTKFKEENPLKQKEKVKISELLVPAKSAGVFTYVATK